MKSLLSTYAGIDRIAFEPSDFNTANFSFPITFSFSAPALSVEFETLE